MSDREIFASRLKILRTKLKKTQKEFAIFVESTPATISAYENATKNASLDVITNIAKKCDVSIDWLCGLSDKEKISSDDIKTYSDIIKRLTDIEKHLKIDCNLINVTYDRLAGELLFYDTKIKSFFKDWSNMIILHASGTIDDNLYSLWINQQLELYEIELQKPQKKTK